MNTVDRLAIDGGPAVRATPLKRTAGHGLNVFGPEEREAALEVLESRSLFRYYGPNLLDKVTAFEQQVRALLDAQHAVGVSSGTAALRTAIAALGIGCGDEIILPCFTFIASANAVVVEGAVPVFAEVDDTLGLDPEDFERRITPRTAAVMVVHLDNATADLDPILSIARRHGIKVIEDAAQALGVSYKGRRVGTLGDVGAFSLQLDKNVTAGEGGLVVTQDGRLYERAVRYQDQGGQFTISSGQTRGDAVEPFVGENLRMTELAGAIAGVQLKKLPDLLTRQRANRRTVVDALRLPERVRLRRSVDGDGDGGSNLSLFLSDAASARRFVAAVLAEGVPAGQLYGGAPVYLTPSLMQKRTASGKGGPWNCAEHPTEIRYGPGLCPRSEELIARSAIVPIGATYTDADCMDVAAAVNKVCAALE